MREGNSVIGRYAPFDGLIDHRIKEEEDAMDDMIKRKQYETERLCIRHFDPADVDSCYKGWGKDEQLGKFIVGYPMPKETMKSFVMTMVENENAWVIVEKKAVNVSDI